MSRMHKMMVKVWLLALVMAWPLASYGQWLVGPVAGMQLTRTTNAPAGPMTYRIDSRMGFHAGFMGVGQLADNRFALVAAAAYSRKGRDLQIEQALMFHTSVLHHLDVPVLLGYRLTPGSPGGTGQLQLYAVAGPDLSLWLGGNGTLSGGELAATGPEKYTVAFGTPDTLAAGQIYYTDANRLQVGLNLGLMAQLPMPKGQAVLLLLRYHHGQSYLSNTGTANAWLTTFSDEPRVAHRFFGLSFAYLWAAQTKTAGRRKRPNNRR